MKTKTSLSVMLFFNLGLVYAQITPTPAPSGFVTKNGDVQVSTATDIPHAEESIAIDKINPLSILISANTKPVSGTSGLGYYYSIDGGSTWAGSDHLPNSGVGYCDPSTVFDAAEQGYIVNLNTYEQIGTTSGANGVIAQTTNDGGLGWNSQVNITGGSSSSDDGIDKEMSGAIDVIATSPYVNYFYTAWTNFDLDNNQGGITAVQFNSSIDGGSTFGTPITLETGSGQGTNVQTGPNGEVYVCWADYAGIGTNSITTGPGKEIAFAADLTDGGTSFTVSDVFAETGLRDPNGSATSAFGSTRIPDFPSMAVDKSCGPYRGRIYIAYTDGFDAGTNLVKVRSSDDHGTTWSSPQTLNILFSTGSGLVSAQCWFPSIAVDDLTGLVNVVFYGIGDPTTFSTSTFVAYSTDGGTSWQSLVVSDESHVTAPISGFPGGYAGDYIGICSIGGHSYATWHDNRSGQWQVYVARIDYAMPLLYSTQSILDIDYPSILDGDATYQAGYEITSTSVAIASGATITYTAGNNIDLLPGFTSNANSNFLAQIKTTYCQTTGISPSFIHLPRQNGTVVQNAFNAGNIYCYPNPTNNNITLAFINGVVEKDIILQIKDVNNRTLLSVPVSQQSNGVYTYEYNTSELNAGVYFFTFQSGSQVLTNKFVKVN